MVAFEVSVQFALESVTPTAQLTAKAQFLPVCFEHMALNQVAMRESSLAQVTLPFRSPLRRPRFHVLRRHRRRRLHIRRRVLRHSRRHVLPQSYRCRVRPRPHVRRRCHRIQPARAIQQLESEALHMRHCRTDRQQHHRTIDGLRHRIDYRHDRVRPMVHGDHVLGHEERRRRGVLAKITETAVHAVLDVQVIDQRAGVLECLPAVCTASRPRFAVRPQVLLEHCPPIEDDRGTGHISTAVQSGIVQTGRSEQSHGCLDNSRLVLGIGRLNATGWVCVR